MSTRKNAIYNVAYRMFSVFLPLVTAPYLSRVVGTEGVGLYSYAWSISYVFCLIGLLGLDTYGVRAIARAGDDSRALERTFSEIFLMQLMVAGATLAVWIGYVTLVAGEEREIALSLTMMSVSCLVNLDWCLMGLKEFKSIALRNTAVKLLAAAAVFVFIRGPQDLWIYGFVWSLSTLLGCVMCAAGLHGKVRLVRVPLKDALAHFKPCAILFTSVLAISVYRTMDKVMVGALSSMTENGLYENAEKIIFCLSGFISAIGTVMLPKASALLSQGREAEVRRHMGLSMELVMCMVSALCFGLIAIATEFTPLFYGEDFTRSATLMIPLALTLLSIGFANVIRTQWILPHGRDAIVIRSVVTGAVLNLIANLLLIPRLGAMGAVVGTLLAEFSVPTVQWLHLRRELPYGRLLLSSLPYFALGGLMVGAVRLVTLAVPLTGWLLIAVQIACGAGVYVAGCLVWWKVRRRQDILRLLRLKKRS